MSIERKTVTKYNVKCLTCECYQETPGYIEDFPSDCPAFPGQSHTIDLDDILFIEEITEQFPDTVALHKNEASGVDIKLQTHDFGDSTTWYQSAVEVTGETLTDSGDGLTFDCLLKGDPEASPIIIDIDSKRLPVRENYLLLADGTFGKRGDFRAVVSVDAEEQTSGVTINWVSGSVTFTSSQAGKTVTMDYHYATDSVFIIKPLATKKVEMKRARVVCSDVDYGGNVVQFDLFAGGSDYPSGNDLSPYNRFAFRYRSNVDFLTNCDNHFIVELAGYTYPIHKFIFDYDNLIILKASYGMELHLSLKEDVAISDAEVAVATFSMEIENE